MKPPRHIHFSSRTDPGLFSTSAQSSRTLRVNVHRLSYPFAIYLVTLLGLFSSLADTRVHVDPTAKTVTLSVPESLLPSAPWSIQYTASLVAPQNWQTIAPLAQQLLPSGETEITITLPGSPNAYFRLIGVAPINLYPLFLNEIMSNNRSSHPDDDGDFSDWIELYNPTPLPIDLSRLALNDRLSLNRAWRFPGGSVLQGLDRTVILFDSSQAASESNTGFGLSSSGDSVFLFAERENGIEIIDSLDFGFQATDISLARLPPDQAWGTATPTPSLPNEAAAEGDPFAIRINEWLARSDQGPDWLELYNPSSGTINLTGYMITDDLGNPSQHVFPPYSILGAGDAAWRQLIADNQPDEGPAHLSFKLAGGGESIALYHPTATLIDAVHFGDQTSNQTEGRLPDGSPNIAPLSNPSPQASNDRDRDQDGMQDQWEIAYGLDPNDPMDAHFDLDEDGLLNLEEFRLGTLPNSPQSGLSITQIEVTSTHIRLTFGALAGRGFIIRSKGSLAESNWTERWRIEEALETRSMTIELANESEKDYFQVIGF